MDLRTFLMQSPDLCDPTDADHLASHWTPKLVTKGGSIAQQAEHDSKEHIILDGSVASNIYGQNGSAVCVGLYVGPCIITPNIARTREGQSLVTMQAMSDVLIAQMDSTALTDLMIASEPIRNWANGVLREELGRKADREWCLAALGGAERLAWFRQNFTGYEEIFTHALIASFLGITPVTLSRLRSHDRGI
ncbi:MAG: Crp/Fnr family transcriptional regulator [Aliishimia sp.]